MAAGLLLCRSLSFSVAENRVGDFFPRGLLDFPGERRRGRRERGEKKTGKTRRKMERRAQVCLGGGNRELNGGRVFSRRSVGESGEVRGSSGGVLERISSDRGVV